MGPVLGHTAERMRILTARVQMTGAEARMGRQELGAPATPERVRTLLKSQFSEEAREKRWLVCEYTVCEPSPYGSPTPWKSSLPSAQSPSTGFSDL